MSINGHFDAARRIRAPMKSAIYLLVMNALRFFDFHLPPSHVLHDLLEDIMRDLLRTGSPPENI
jgi:hypothetical protein